MLKILDAKAVILVSDALNQLILQKLAMNQNSIADLSRELNIPPLKLWRRMQKLQKAKLVEVTGTEKVGNLEKKLYRATALRYDVPQQFIQPKLDDGNIQGALVLFNKIQGDWSTIFSTFDGDIPKEGNPTDFAIYAYLQAFAQTFEQAETRANVQEMKLLLAKFRKPDAALG